MRRTAQGAALFIYNGGDDESTTEKKQGEGSVFRLGEGRGGDDCCKCSRIVWVFGLETARAMIGHVGFGSSSCMHAAECQTSKK